MTKELEAFEQMKKYLINLKFHFLEEELSIVETALKRLPELEKAFVSLSKEDEKTKKLLSKEIEKNRALEIIKEMLDSDVGYKLNANSRKILKEIFESLPKEKQDLLKEVLCLEN